MKNSFYLTILITTLILSGCKFNKQSSSSSDYNTESADTLAYKQWNLDTTDAACKSKYRFCPNAKISYPILQTPDSLVNNYLQKEIQSILLSRVDDSPFPSIEEAVRSYFQESRTIKEEGDYDNESSAWAWERSIEISHKKGRFLTVKSNEYSYMGGAHPNYTTYYKTYDLLDKKEIHTEDLFINLKDTALLQIGEKYFRIDNEIKPEESFSEIGFFVFGEGEDFENSLQFGRFRFNTNFGLSPEGIVFLYNSYEIGPYAIGVHSVTIPYNELRPFLKMTLW